MQWYRYQRFLEIWFILFRNCTSPDILMSCYTMSYISESLLSNSSVLSSGSETLITISLFRICYYSLQSVSDLEFPLPQYTAIDIRLKIPWSGQQSIISAHLLRSPRFVLPMWLRFLFKLLFLALAYDQYTIYNYAS